MPLQGEDRVSNMKRLFGVLMAAGLALSAAAGIAGAQSGGEKKEAGEEKELDLPRSGSLAGTLTSGRDSKAVPMPWGDTDISGKKKPPISASISRLNATRWILKVFNNSEDRYSIDLEVVQFGQGSRRLSSNHYSYFLKPQQSAERQVSTTSLVTNCEVNLSSWRNPDAEKRQKEAKVKAAATAAVQTAAAQAAADARQSEARRSSEPVVRPLPSPVAVKPPVTPVLGPGKR